MSTTFLYGAHVRVNGIRQHYLRYGGQGDPLFVVPGITSPAVTWDFVAERLGAKFDTYVMDVRGRGLSSAGPELSYGLDDCSKDIAELSQSLGIARYHLLGHSLGARIAARHARQYADRVRSLLLGDPPLSGPGRRSYVRSLLFYIEPIEAAKAGTIDIRQLRATYPHWTEAQLRTRAEWLHTCDVAAIAANHRGFAEEEIHSDFPLLRMPTLLLAASEGGVISDEELEEVARLLPSMRTVRMQGVGHMLPFEDLEGFLEHTLRFLRSIEPEP